MAARPDRDPLNRRRLILQVAVVVFVVAVGLALWVPRGDDRPSPDPTTPPPTGPAAAPTDDRTAGRTPDPVAPRGFPAGAASVSDAAGDLADPAGDPPPEPQPAGDLVGASLTSDGAELVATFELAGDVPDDVSNLLWEVHLHVRGERAYTISAQQLGTERHTGVLDWDSGRQTPLEAPAEVDGPRLTLRVPAAQLERIDGPFTWAASTQYDDAYSDFAPDLVGDQTETVPFPG